MDHPSKFSEIKSFEASSHRPPESSDSARDDGRVKPIEDE